MRRTNFFVFISALIFPLAFSGCNTAVDNSDDPSTSASYTVTIAAEIKNGTVSADKSTAKKGEVVTLTLAANNGYEFDSISVKNASNNAITTTKLTTGTKYTFKMPESDVTVNAAFVKSGIEGSKVFIRGRDITIRPTLWACDHEVTQEEYQSVIGSNPSNFISNPAEEETQKNRPVEQVSWYDCLVYCNKRSMNEHLIPCYKIGGKTDPSEWGNVPTLSDATWDEATCDFNADGYRLPTEAEWEYLARGGNTTNEGQTTYSGSNTIGDVAWYSGNSGDKSHEVKKKRKNALGLYDMSGNVWEWCWDWYGTISSTTPSDGASSGSRHILRGGGWHYDADNCTVANRLNYGPNTRSRYLGFRVVRSSSN